MTLTDTDLQIIKSFRAWIEQRAAETGQFGKAHRADREDGSALATRFEAGEHVWFELTVRPLIPQIRAALVTDDRWKSEELEQAIQDSGDTMGEFVETGFDEVDLDWADPIVEHYRDADRFFHFATPLDVDTIEALRDPATRDKALKMLEGYHAAFAEVLTAETN